ncbi:MAG TPA: hypothetical protein VMG32_14405 [Anaeromyxobacteraceae bacterium]|nr:hypothetical protein [Anaeromyxobacteraceae bacterium]
MTDVAVVHDKAAAITTAVTTGANLTEQAMLSALGIVRVAHGEVFHIAHGALGWLESVQAAPFKVVREVVGRSEKLTLDALNGVENVALSLSRTLRESGEAAGEVVSRTTEALVGKKAVKPA